MTNAAEFGTQQYEKVWKLANDLRMLVESKRPIQLEHASAATSECQLVHKSPFAEIIMRHQQVNLTKTKT